MKIFSNNTTLRAIITQISQTNHAKLYGLPQKTRTKSIQKVRSRKAFGALDPAFFPIKRPESEGILQRVRPNGQINMQRITLNPYI